MNYLEHCLDYQSPFYTIENNANHLATLLCEQWFYDIPIFWLQLNSCGVGLFIFFSLRFYDENVHLLTFQIK
jgi:hypothetical protein